MKTIKVPPFVANRVPERNMLESAGECAKRCCRLIEHAWRDAGHAEVRAWVAGDGSSFIGSNLAGGLPPRGRA